MTRETMRARLAAARVGIAGCGGLGSNCAAALARAGVGRLVLADFDLVSEANLDRQFFFRDQVGAPKALALADNLRRIDPALWVTNRNSCWEAHDRLEALRHYPLLTQAQIRQLARCDPFERRVGRLVQYPSLKKKVRRA